MNLNDLHLPDLSETERSQLLVHNIQVSEFLVWQCSVFTKNAKNNVLDTKMVR